MCLFIICKVSEEKIFGFACELFKCPRNRVKEMEKNQIRQMIGTCSSFATNFLVVFPAIFSFFHEKLFIEFESVRVLLHSVERIQGESPSAEL